MTEQMNYMLEMWSKTNSISLASDICAMLLKESGSGVSHSDELIANVIQWGREKRLNDAKAQLNKVIEEVGEVAHEVTRERYNTDEMADGIGDTLVTIIILADIVGLDPMECLSMAYNTIKDRKGHTDNGTFIKEQ